MLSAFLVCCIHSNALQTGSFHGDFFIEDNVTEEQPNLGPYCLQYKLHNKTNSKLHKNNYVAAELPPYGINFSTKTI